MIDYKDASHAKLIELHTMARERIKELESQNAVMRDAAKKVLELFDLSYPYAPLQLFELDQALAESTLSADDLAAKEQK